MEQRKVEFELWGRSFSLVLTKTVSSEGDVSIDVSIWEGGNIINKKKIDLASIHYGCPHCRERLFVDLEKLDIRINGALSEEGLVMINIGDCCASKDRHQQIPLVVETI